MTAAKAAGANESAWLDYADRAVQTAERSFKESLKTQAIPQDWLRDNPKPSFETKGGALGDIPQKPVEYLNGLSLASARDKVTRVAIGLEQPDPLDLDENEEDSDAEETSAPEGTAQPTRSAMPRQTLSFGGVRPA
jgi:hypothetical protein